MFGGSVRDRIRAAEAAQGGEKGHSSSHRHRGHKLALNTDEHIKEEFLRRGDGGWSKKVDIGQQEAYVPPPDVPFIKVTLETPIVESKSPSLPGKLPKSAFESISEENEGETRAPGAVSSAPVPPAAAEATSSSAPPLVTVEDKGKAKEKGMEDGSTRKSEAKTAPAPAPKSVSVPEVTPEPAKKKLEPAKEQPKIVISKEEDEPRPKSESAVPTIDPAKREVHPEYAEDTMHRSTPSRSGSRRRSSKKHLHARVDDHYDSHDEEHQRGLDFHDVDWSGSGSRTPSRASSKRRHRKSSSTRDERPILEYIGDDSEHLSRSRSKSAHREYSEHHVHHEHRSHSRHSHHSHAEVPSSPRIHKSSSRSGSTHRHGSESHHSPPSSARHSSNTLWPSFSSSERRSVSDMLDPGSIRSKPPRPRTHSTSSIRTDTTTTSKAVEFAEYFAGQKLEHTVSVPLSPPIKQRPLGFVRSKSSTGEYHEYYTRDKYLLRKPDEDVVFEVHEDQKIHIEHRRHGSHGGNERKKEDDTPWQVKLMQGIARH